MDTQLTFRSMATDVKLRVLDPVSDIDARIQAACDVFARVSQSCTRFDPTSPLMQANARPEQWHEVPWECAAAVIEAAEAHRATSGLFDPRIIGSLVRLGYDRSLPFATGGVAFESSPAQAGPTSEPAAVERSGVWRPRWEQRGDHFRIHLDGSPIDLGGIGKGLAVRWAAEMLEGSGSSVMVDAGGDCQFAGVGPSGEGWRVGMEDPRGGLEPLLVLSLTDVGCATSSVRVRRWQVDGREVHHLIDPRTGRSGGEGLLSVTVVHPDVAWAEVWSKTLFLSGPARVRDLALEVGLGAAWVTDDGRVHTNDLIGAQVIWTGAHV